MYQSIFNCSFFLYFNTMFLSAQLSSGPPGKAMLLPMASPPMDHCFPICCLENCFGICGPVVKLFKSYLSIRNLPQLTLIYRVPHKVFFLIVLLLKHRCICLKFKSLLASLNNIKPQMYLNFVNLIQHIKLRYTFGLLD